MTNDWSRQEAIIRELQLGVLREKARADAAEAEVAMLRDQLRRESERLKPTVEHNLILAKVIGELRAALKREDDGHLASRRSYYPAY